MKARLHAGTARQMLVLAVRQILAQLLADRRRPWKRNTKAGDLKTRSIALVKLDGIGDFVLATGFLRLLHKNVPAQNVTLFCCTPVGALASREFPGWRVIELGERNLLQARKTRKQLRSSGPFELLVDLRAWRTLSDTLASSWIRAHSKIGIVSDHFDKSSAFWGESAIFDDLLICNSDSIPAGISVEIGNYTQLAQALFPDAISEPLLPNLTATTTAQHELTQHILCCHGIDIRSPFLLVCPGSLQRIKEYPVGHLAAVVRDVATATGTHVVVAGSQNDSRTTQPLLRLLAGLQNVSDLSGKLDLEQHAVLTSMATAVLTMDSATAHIAGALHRPAVIILGGGHPGVFGPWGESDTFRWLQNPLSCYGCHWRCVQSRPMCIEDIPADSIRQNLLEILQNSS